MIPASRAALLRHAQLSSLDPAPRAAPAAPRAILFIFSLVPTPRAACPAPSAAQSSPVLTVDFWLTVDF
ncbi:hypothetical protein A2U01_0075385 [Trifolium medium]|uniref:Uncharacterized protein n=1 Tax=Trifolium medium TaxID=97028 RepID=A0A392T175_9FABA|nr:hypothetical protein [Trifolium medium]